MLVKIIFLIYSMQCIYNSQSRIDNIVRDIFTENLMSRLQVLQGGLSSPGVYKFKNDNKKYVLRLSHPNRPLLERSRTIKCYKIAAKNGIAPPIKYTNVEKGIIVSNYISGHHVSKKDLLNNKLLTKLAETIRKLHNIDCFPRFKDIFSIRQSFEKKALVLNSDLILNAANYLKLIDSIIVQDKTILVATHNDLKPENILFDTKFMIIDWEAACLGYPCFDMATIIVFYNLSGSEQDKFLEAYYGRDLTLKEKARIEIFKKEVLGYYGMAYLMLSVHKKLPPLSFEEINNLSNLSDYLENKFAKNNILNSYIEAQKLGWILIKELNKDISV